VSFAFCTPLSLLLHGGRCLTFLSLPTVQDSVMSLPATEGPPPRRTPPCCATPLLHRHAAVSSESTPRLLAQRLVLLIVTLPPKTLPCLDLYSDSAGHAKAPATRVATALNVSRARPGIAWPDLPGGPCQQASAPLLRRPPRPKDRGHGPDSVHALSKPFLFPFYLNKFQKIFKI
jgi:hypothetical protein